MPDDTDLFDDKGMRSPQKEDTAQDDNSSGDFMTSSTDLEETEDEEISESTPESAGDEGIKPEEGTETEEESQGDKELTIEDGSVEEDGGEEGSLEEAPGNEEDRPYTIAQLAQAQTKRRTLFKKRLPSLRRDEEEKEKELAPSMPEGQLAIDVFETTTHIVVKSTIAGVKPEDLDIGIEDSTLNIRGSRSHEEKVKGEDYFYQECYWGTFSRSVILPVEVDAEGVEASLKDGILTVRLPKIVKEKEKKIKVSTG